MSPLKPGQQSQTLVWPTRWRLWLLGAHTLLPLHLSHPALALLVELRFLHLYVFISPSLFLFPWPKSLNERKNEREREREKEGSDINEIAR